MPLRLVHLEDDPLDAELVREALVRDGVNCAITLAIDQQSFLQAIAEEPELVLADFSLPGFDGLTAQELLRARWPDVPLIFVSGSLGEERAIEALRSGATDYVLKHRLTPLSKIVQRALSEVEERRRRRHAEEELRTLNAELEQRVAARTKELEEAYAAIAGREEDLRRSERFLASVVEHVPDVMFVKDAASLRYVRLNRALSHILKTPVADIVGRSDAELFAPAEAKALAERDRAALRGKGVDVREESICTRDQGWRTFHTKRVPIVGSDGAPQYLLGIARDVTEQNLADHAIKHARIEAERANRAKSEFLSRMSHELRTPLNAVLGFAQLFELDTLTPRQAENVQQIARGGKHLLGLINEVLDISRIEAGHLALAPEAVSVHAVAVEVLEMIRPLAETQQITINVTGDDSLYATADRQRLKQILLNLCSNAVKYNRAGHSVQISCSTADGQACVAVRDNGHGIPADKLPLLFTPFERLGVEQSGIEGTGLGLALCKRLTEVMNGALAVESRVGVGSTFSLYLPVATQPANPVAQPPASTATPARIASSGTVLYIEDTEANTRLVARVLEQRPGVRLLHAPDARRGLALLDQHHPALVMLDLHLPDMPGEQVLSVIRENSGSSDTTVAILTADATVTQRQRLLAKGADAYLTKPLDIREVLAVVDQVLGSAAA
jgi:PAS domain S-box-containing protein